MKKIIGKVTNQQGFSLIELLVVISIFSILAVLVTQSIALTLRGSKKSESLFKVRGDVSYAMNIMERLIRGAREITCSADYLTLDYIDEHGTDTSFSCEGGVNGYIASESARLTSDSTNIDCSLGNVFNCSSPNYVEISITAESADASGIEGSKITSSTKILLRVY